MPDDSLFDSLTRTVETLSRIQNTTKKLSDTAKKLNQAVSKTAKKDKQLAKAFLKRFLNNRGMGTFTTDVQNLITDLTLLGVYNEDAGSEYSKMIIRNIKLQPGNSTIFKTNNK